MMKPILYSFRRCPYAMRARMSLILSTSQCEIREILLKQKPVEMLEISPKGTVPVLQLADKILDESLDIIAWAMSNNSQNIYQYSDSESNVSNKFIELFDSKFKYHLDRYKYASRYDADPLEHRQTCFDILMSLEAEISPAPWIFGTQVSLLDISILPFIRQFKIANPSWFFAQDFKKLINLLNTFETSNLFKLAMEKYEIWDPKSSDKIIFPPKSYKPIES